jgi:mannose-1-phosphate guanylyltransferase
VVPGNFTWDEVGNWDALARVRPRDKSGNVIQGPVHLHEVEDTIVWSDGEPIVLSGVRDLIVVRANGRILVMSRKKAADLKAALDTLPPEIRDLP